MFACFVHGLRNVYWKRIFLPGRMALFSSEHGNRFKDRQKFVRRQRSGTHFTQDAGIRHTLNIMKETTTKRSRQLMDPEEADELEETDFDQQILKANRVYDEMNREGAAKRNYVVNKIIEQKYFKPPAEPNLLTYAAKEQVKYLYETDPKTWTPEKLTESFPVSVTAVKKLLKNKLYPLSEEEISKHDKAVRRNWDRMRSPELNGGPISSAIDHRLLSTELDYKEMNPSLPIPSNEWKMTRLPQNSQVPRRPPGEFENLLKLDSKKDKENVSALPLPNGVVFNDRIDDFSSKSKRFVNNQSVSIDEFKRNLKQSVSSNLEARRELDEYISKNDKRLSVPVAKSEEIRTKSPHDDMFEYFEGNIQKFKEVATPDLKWDVRKGVSNENSKEAYIYDAKLGYQRPYGSYRNKESVQIATDKDSKPGTIYRKNDSYYSEDGEFLYRVPFSNE